MKKPQGVDLQTANEQMLAAVIARRIFEAGDFNGQCLRIQYKIGKNPERDGAGWAEDPLVDFIAKVLKENRPPTT